MSRRVAVVTGSNKGIGYAIVKGLCQRFDGTVYLTSRDDNKGRAALAKLQEQGFNPEYHQLDVADKSSVIRFHDYIKGREGGIDILINNAAVCSTAMYNAHDVNRTVVEINYKSMLTIQEALFPLVRDDGRILNISSDCGHLSNVRNEYWIERLSRKDLSVDDIDQFVDWYLEADKNGTFNKEDIADDATVAAYRISKVAVSALTMLQQKQLASRNVSVNSMHPGLVRTDMTNHVGFYSTDRAAETPIYLVLDAPQTLKGAYVWFDRKVLDWYDYNADYYFKSKTLLM